MKKLAVALLVIVMLGGIARAGVVVEEDQESDRGVGTPVKHTITVMVQGHKQKSVIDDGKQSLITNLDAGTRTMISAERKIYVEMPFPPKMMPMMPGADAKGIVFTKTGDHHTVAGYACDDYTGTGTMAGNQMTVLGCFSTVAPGAAEFTSFQQAMAAKVKGTPMAMMANSPAGVPLRIDTSMKVTHVQIPGMTAQQSAEMNQKLASRPPVVTHMTVTKISTETLAADTFTAPKGYTKQQMPMMGPGMARPAMGGATSGQPAPMMPPPKSNKVQE